MSGDLWQGYGLTQNPFQTSALTEGGALDVGKVFVGRDKEINKINSVIKNSSHSILILGGSVGVGKTSLVNHIKKYWKYSNSAKGLFSSRREIETNIQNLTKKRFILEIISSIINEIELVDPTLLRNPILRPIVSLISVINTGGLRTEFGINYGIGSIKTSNSEEYYSSGEIPDTALEAYLKKLIKIIKEKGVKDNAYDGVLVHVNNLDVILSEQDGEKALVRFFDEIRDLLTFDNIHYVFIGPKDMYKRVIGSRNRVSSIVSDSPILIDPLSKTQIIEAIYERIVKIEKYKILL